MDSRWMWMMEYCKRNGLPPAQSWAWKQAEEAYGINDKRKILFEKWKSLGCKVRDLGTVFQNPIDEYELTPTDVVKSWISMLSAYLNVLSELIEDSYDFLERYIDK